MKNEEIWIIIDVDDRQKNKFDPLFAWCEGNEKHGIAISNPNFEYWLLLHFEDGNGLQSVADCMTRLKQYLPHYRKNNLGINFLENKELTQTILNAKKQHKSWQDWHTDNHSMVYMLIEKILIEEEKRASKVFIKDNLWLKN